MVNPKGCLILLFCCMRLWKDYRNKNKNVNVSLDKTSPCSYPVINDFSHCIPFIFTHYKIHVSWADFMIFDCLRWFGSTRKRLKNTEYFSNGLLLFYFCLSLSCNKNPVPIHWKHILFRWDNAWSSTFPYLLFIYLTIHAEPRHICICYKLWL